MFELRWLNKRHEYKVNGYVDRVSITKVLQFRQIKYLDGRDNEIWEWTVWQDVPVVDYE